MSLWCVASSVQDKKGATETAELRCERAAMWSGYVNLLQDWNQEKVCQDSCTSYKSVWREVSRFYNSDLFIRGFFTIIFCILRFSSVCITHPCWLFHPTHWSTVPRNIPMHQQKVRMLLACKYKCKQCKFPKYFLKNVSRGRKCIQHISWHSKVHTMHFGEKHWMKNTWKLHCVPLNLSRQSSLVACLLYDRK